MVTPSVAAAGIDQTFWPHGWFTQSTFSKIFHGLSFSFGRQRGPRRTKNLVHQLSVSLEDMYNGTVRKLALQKNVICDGCEGIGGKPGAVQKCPNCRGTGMQVCGLMKHYSSIMPLY